MELNHKKYVGSRRVEIRHYNYTSLKTFRQLKKKCLPDIIIAVNNIKILRDRIRISF